MSTQRKNSTSTAVKNLPQMGLNSHGGKVSRLPTRKTTPRHRRDLSFVGVDGSPQGRLMHWLPMRAPDQDDQWNRECQYGQSIMNEVFHLQENNESEAYNCIRFALNSGEWRVGGWGAESGFADSLAALVIAGMRALRNGSEPFTE